MQRILIITFLILASIWFLGSIQTFPPENQNQEISTSTRPIVAAVSTSTITTTKTATTTKSNRASATKAKLITAQQKSIAAPVVPPTAPESPTDFTPINTYARQAIVNILCETGGNELSPITGTGVVIDPKGIILTNAHIGEYLLLKDLYKKDFVKCFIRTGSPAYPRYNVELVYISPTWVINNKSLLKETNPKGNGENDFAILRISSMIDGTELPTSFPYIAINTRETIKKNEPVILISYPAGFLGGLSVIQDLNITSAVTTIQSVFTFKESTIDLISVPGTVISQKGSSGGAVVDKKSTLIGIISTTSDGNTTADRDLRAITLAHINRSLEDELGVTLSQLLSDDLIGFAQKFQKTVAPTLTKLIADELNKQ